MNEIQALSVIDEALTAVADKEAIGRILAYVNAKHGHKPNPVQLHGVQGVSLETSRAAPISRPARDHGGNEIPGIAVLSDGGEFRLTVRDPKAKNTNDAAVRLALIAIYSYCQLSGEKTASSKRIVKPILEKWRAYTGNTRVVLANHAGILRDGDALTLDHHATLEAEQYMEDVKDANLTGTWQPSGAKIRTVRKSLSRNEEE